MDEIRINKFLADSGICSRREADRLILEGRVLVNGKPASQGLKVGADDTVSLDGRRVGGRAREERELIAFYKPRGIVCTSSDKDGVPNIIDYINYDKRLFTIGRLDKDSEGLILLTNRGELVNKVNKGEFGHEKEYAVTCRNRIDDEFITRMSEGMVIEVPFGKMKEPRKVRTDPCEVQKTGYRSFRIVLKQGFNRQIRRMCQKLGNEVIRLKRIRVMNIELGSLKEGELRLIEGQELKQFESMLGI